MDSVFLQHALEVSGLTCTDTRYEENRMILEVEYAERKEECPHCGSHALVKNGFRHRTVLTVPVGLKSTVLHMKVQRYKCKHCGRDEYEKISFVDGNRSYSHAFAGYVVFLLKKMTIQAVAELTGLSWDVIKEIHTTYLERHYSIPSLEGVKFIGIDEFAVKKGHTYMTIVVDLETGRILHVGEGRGADALTAFWERVKEEQVEIEQIATDMSSAFSKSVRENAPHATYVFDHFHIIKLMNDTVDQVRREVVAMETDKQKKRLIKGTRFILMANGEKITDPDGRARLERALKINKPLSQAYYLKEELREIYRQPSIKEAEERLDSWISMAKETEVAALVKIANTIAKTKNEILAWYKARISTAKVEGINNKIKVMKRAAYGFRDKEYFKLRLFALHDAKITRNVG